MAPLMLLVMGMAGFGAALAVAAYFVFLLWFRFRQEARWSEFYLYSITFLLLFDSSAFSFTAFKIRLWYPLLLLGLSWNLVVRKKAHPGVPMIGSRSGVFLLSLYLAFSALWLFWDQTDGRLSNLKYLLFSVGLILFFRSTWLLLGENQRAAYWRYLATLSVFVSLWGIMQWGFNTLTTLGSRFQLDWFNVRPSAFFSETTWYAEYCLLGFFVVLYLISRRQVGPAWILYCVPLLGSLLISNTRNAFVGLAAGGVGLILLSFFGLKSERSALRNRWTWGLMAVGTASVVFLAFFASGELIAQYQRIAQRFVGGDPSSLSRLEAFSQSLVEIADGWFTGHGYTWYPHQGTEAGTFTGSKSFNLLLMIGYIFGWFGLLAFLGTTLVYLRRALGNWLVLGWLEAKYALVLFGVFFLMSMFTPVHQFPFGLMVFGLATVMHRRADA